MVSGSIDPREAPTEKVRAVTKEDERMHAKMEYERAMQALIENPTEENKRAFAEANKNLFEVEDLYRIAARLLLERATRVLNAIRGRH